MPAYTEFDSANPQASQAPTPFSTSALNDLRALRDGVITGRIPGWVQSRVTGTGPGVDRPQRLYWMNATLSIGFKMQMTWGGTGTVQPLTVGWFWTSGADWNATPESAVWTQMGSTQSNTFDANDNITVTTFSGGITTLIFEIWAKCLRVVAGLATHVAATGTSVHGLGSASTASLTAMAIAGTSSFNGSTGVGNSTAVPVDATRVRENFVDLGAIGNGATATMNASLYGHFAMTPSATLSHTMTVAVSNPPAAGKSQTIMFEIINGDRDIDGRITWPASFKWMGGSSNRPNDTTLEAAGRNLFSATTRDGGTVWDVMHMGKRG
jgi:hypothetical protein